ncbi:disease resistance protein At4g27190 isoform X3 [Capsicum annuum]|uniref:disease resistance protein At4g27190 isoform X3 n=1 Tax=Capsicum annuum TaxID=4072 RepID=UPI001FB0B4D9|nr:disease resistance protein At4g27190 isoform X3 [Capsicum annuum]
MEILFNAVGGFVVEVGKFVSKCIYPTIENIVHFSSKTENLRTEMEELTALRDDIKQKVEVAEGEGYKRKPDVIKWLKDVHKLENEWEAMQESIAAATMLVYKCCPKCSLRSEVSTQAKNIRDQFCKLKEVGENFGSNLVVENYRVKKVEFIPGPSIQGQLTATRNLNKLLRLLEDVKVFIIGVWGAGGVGKTTLVINLNNELLKTGVLGFKLSFGVVIWVTVPKPPIDIRRVQAQIASRLNVKIDSEGSDRSISSKICERLKEETSFLLILDDVWEPINLDDVGVPQLATRSKVIITSRFSSVCSQMKTDVEMKVYTLDEDESWQLFAKNVGDIVNLEQIHPLAKEISRECDGLPLAIMVIGSSMRGQMRVELWEDALKSLRMSEPHSKVVEDKVYKVIKWSFDSFGSQDIESSSEQRSKRVNKKRGDIQSCFLYCSLYPAAIPTDDLIHCWWIEGLLGEHDTYEEAYNRGITMTERLKDACLLESHGMDSAKMHDVVRDVSRWIANSFGDEQNLVFQAGIGLTEISHIKVSTSVKRISFASSNISGLPDNFMECPEATTLLLQDNGHLWDISREFFLAFPSLRVLNLSQTGQLKEIIGQGFFLSFSSIEMLNMKGICVGSTSLDEILSLHNLTSLFIKLDSSSIFNREPTWMTRLKRFHIIIGDYPTQGNINKSARTICVSECEIFSNGELSGMLQFASDLYLEYCKDLSKLIGCNSFNGLKSLSIQSSLMEEGIRQFDPFPNLEYLSLKFVYNLRSVSDFSQHLGFRFSKLRQLEISDCRNLKYLFKVGAFSIPKHLDEITVEDCQRLVALIAQYASTQTTLVNSEIPRVRKLVFRKLSNLTMLREPQRMWEHLEELKVYGCAEIRKLPRSIQTSNYIKLIEGSPMWWRQLEWDDDIFKSNLEKCFQWS